MDFVHKFLSYYPLKQGLKLLLKQIIAIRVLQFLSYYPLKQGLKHNVEVQRRIDVIQFLSYYPLKQGLKLNYPSCPYWHPEIFILLSIKTRIETWGIQNK